MARDPPATVFNGPKTVETGRDARGRFLPANAGGGRPANPFARYQGEWRQALLAEVTPADVRAVIRKVLQLAKRGYVPAAAWLRKWTQGGPPPVVDPDKLEAHEREVWTGRLTMLDHLALTADASDDDPKAEAPAETAEAAESGEPSLRTTLAWALEELAGAQTALRAQRPDRVTGWEAFAASALDWDPQAAVPVDLL
jgi:hypothetical protein